MFKKVFRLINYFGLKSINEDIQQEKPLKKEDTIPKSLNRIRHKLESYFSNCSGLTIREITLNNDADKVNMLVVFMDGLVNKDQINMGVIRPIFNKCDKQEIKKNAIIDILKEQVINIGGLMETDSFSYAMDRLLSGETILYIEGVHKALIIDTKALNGRAVDESTTDTVVRGPREAFVEEANVNIALLRRRIKNPKLKFEKIQLGAQTNTEVYISYIEGIVHGDIVHTVKRRLENIKTDAILDSGYLEEFIEDAPFSIFPTVGNSEKPDVIAAKILEGRVAILCNGSPFVLTVPYLFIECIQSSEDYYSRWYFASLVRMFTILGFAFSVALPGFYVALVSFHQDVIPIRLLLTIAATQEGIPFSPFTEAIFMGLVFEILIEAGIRMPKPIGQAISIVGALVLGDAVVKAGLISSPMIIITALTAISSFLVPHMRGVMPFLRLAFIIVANILGLMGLMLMAIYVLIHLCSLRSFGTPYLSPLSPLNGMDLKDVSFRAPLWTMITRPSGIIRNNADKSKLKMKVNYIKRED